MEASPFVENDRTPVPFRAVAEALGDKVDWREDTRTVTVEKEGRTVRLQAGSARAEVDGEETPMDCPAQLRGDRVFVPLRFISESLGARVDWQDSPPTVLIRTAAGESLPLSEEICPLLAGRLTMRLPAGAEITSGNRAAGDYAQTAGLADKVGLLLADGRRLSVRVTERLQYATEDLAGGRAADAGAGDAEKTVLFVSGRPK